MGRTYPSEELVVLKPDSNLFHPIVFISLFSQVIISWMFLLGVNIDIRFQKWFVPHDPSSQNMFLSFETTCTFLIAQFLIANMSLSFNISKPFKSYLFTNSKLIFHSNLFSFIHNLYLFVLYFFNLFNYQSS